MSLKKISIDEALNILTKYHDRCIVNIINANDEESIQAYNMAVNSLKAWKTVEEEIKNNDYRYSLAREFNEFGNVVWSENLIPTDKVLKIIHRQLNDLEKKNDV